jgi:hypothetical protein
VNARPKASTSRDTYYLPSLSPPRQVAHPAPRRWQKSHSHRCFLAWLQRHVHQALAELVVASLAVSASGTVNVIVTADEIGLAMAQW